MKAEHDRDGTFAVITWRQAEDVVTPIVTWNDVRTFGRSDEVARLGEGGRTLRAVASDECEARREDEGRTPHIGKA